MKVSPELQSLGRKIAGILLLGFGLLVFILICVSVLRDFPIWFFGRSVSARVEETWVEETGENNAGELSFQYFIRYNFTTPEGQIITGTSNLAAMEWSALGSDGQVMVTYFPLNPSHNRIDDSRLVPLLLCSYIPLIIIGWLGWIAGWNLISAEFKKIETDSWLSKNE